MQLRHCSLIGLQRRTRRNNTTHKTRKLHEFSHHKNEYDEKSTFVAKQVQQYFKSINGKSHTSSLLFLAHSDARVHYAHSIVILFLKLPLIFV